MPSAIGRIDNIINKERLNGKIHWVIYNTIHSQDIIRYILIDFKTCARCKSFLLPGDFFRSPVFPAL